MVKDDEDGFVLPNKSKKSLQRKRCKMASEHEEEVPEPEVLEIRFLEIKADEQEVSFTFLFYLWIFISSRYSY